jgi:hypothetical protein
LVQDFYPYLLRRPYSPERPAEEVDFYPIIKMSRTYCEYDVMNIG